MDALSNDPWLGEDCKQCFCLSSDRLKTSSRQYETHRLTNITKRLQSYVSSLTALSYLGGVEFGTHLAACTVRHCDASQCKRESSNRLNHVETVKDCCDYLQAMPNDSAMKSKTPLCKTERSYSINCCCCTMALSSMLMSDRCIPHSNKANSQ